MLYVEFCNTVTWNAWASLGNAKKYNFAENFSLISSAYLITTKFLLFP